MALNEQEKAGRTPMQEWSSAPAYFPESLWEKIQRRDVSNLGALDGMIDFLVGMGLRAPSEQSQAMIAAIILMKDKGPTTTVDTTSSRTIYLNVKNQLRARIERARKPIWLRQPAAFW